METKAPVFIASIVSPFALVGVLTLLIIRFGWAGIIILAIIIVMAPLQAGVGKANATILKEGNISKDQRIKFFTEIIEGVKFIKIYGWESAFKSIICDIRHKEIRSYFKLTFTQSLERALGNWSPIIAGLSCFFVLHQTGGSLSTAKIFSTLELMATARVIVYFFGRSMSFYFEFKVILERFCSLYNSEDKRMIEIDAETK